MTTYYTILSMTDAQLDEWIRATEEKLDDYNDMGLVEYDIEKDGLDFAKKVARLHPEHKQQLRELEAQRLAAWEEKEKADRKRIEASRAFHAMMKALGLT